MIKSSSLRGGRRPTRQSILLLWIASLTLAMTNLAHAESSTYSPEICEFSISFPDTPYTTRRCEDGNQARCYDLVSFTKVYELSTTVNFQVICNPISAETVVYYHGDVMRDTLALMGRDNQLKEFETSFREEETYKQAGLVGESLSGRTPGIYIAQLWIGKSSTFSVEAEIIGETFPAADALFSDILKSVKPKLEENSTVESDPPSQKSQSDGSDSNADPNQSP